jgi:hypothetical protein
VPGLAVGGWYGACGVRQSILRVPNVGATCKVAPRPLWLPIPEDSAMAYGTLPVAEDSAEGSTASPIAKDSAKASGASRVVDDSAKASGGVGRYVKPAAWTPAATADAKNNGSCSTERPIEVGRSPEINNRSIPATVRTDTSR